MLLELGNAQWHKNSFKPSKNIKSGKGHTGALESIERYAQRMFNYTSNKFS